MEKVVKVTDEMREVFRELGNDVEMCEKIGEGRTEWNDIEIGQMLMGVSLKFETENFDDNENGAFYETCICTGSSMIGENSYFHINAEDMRKLVKGLTLLLDAPTEQVDVLSFFAHMDEEDEA